MVAPGLDEQSAQSGDRVGLAPPLDDDSVAALVARALVSRGVRRVFALCGGHIMPLWMSLAKLGVHIVDVRDERSAVFMAHAHAHLTDEVAVALVTSGPGVTNAITGVANAHVSGARVLLIGGRPPTAQFGRGALQDLPHVEMLRPVTRLAVTVERADLALLQLDRAIAATGDSTREPGPAYIEFPTDVLRQLVPRPVQLPEHFTGCPTAKVIPDPDAIDRAVSVLWNAKRPLVIAGRGARGAAGPLVKLLDALGAAYLDTSESRGLVSDDHPSVVAATRARIMREADVVLTVGRRLDFQLAYGSPAVFGDASFVRVGTNTAEVEDNRRASVALVGDVGAILEAIRTGAAGRASVVDAEWVEQRRAEHVARSRRLVETMRAAADDEFGVHPLRLVAALRDALPSPSVFVADGGDILSFARVGIEAEQYLDPGPLGCIGVGTAFGVAASLALQDHVVTVLTGDGAFGFSAMELDTAVRHRAELLVVVANNAAWQIEVHDQVENHFGPVGTRLRSTDYAAMARALGLYGARVVRGADLPSAIAAALANRPSLLDVVVSPNPRSSDSMSGLAWVPDLQAIAAWDAVEASWRAGRHVVEPHV